MSRDHHITYNLKLACFTCRKSWRKGSYAREARPIPTALYSELLSCPQCRGQLISVGVDFKAPAQSNVRQWRKVEQLVAAGVRFEVRRFTQAEGDMAGPGPRPYSLRELKPFLEARHAHEQQLLRQKRKQEKLARRRERLLERKGGSRDSTS